VQFRFDPSADAGRARRKNGLLAALFLLALLAAFVLGANHFRKQYWPFGRQYFALLEDRLSSLRKDPARTVRLQSVFAALDARVYAIPLDDALSPSGPFEVLSDSEFLFIGKCGDVVFASIEDRYAGALAAKASSHLDALVSTGEAVPREPVHCEGNAGVKGSALRSGRLYVAMHVRDETSSGLQLVVREYRLADNRELRFQRELFRSFPPVQGEFREEFSGGKLALVGAGQLAVALGDSEQAALVQQDGNSMGKVFMIDLVAGTAREYTRGHRSPSGGLFYDAEARQLWLSEHGPKGGDEINLLAEGANYGWPVVSYGTVYPNDHEHYEQYAGNWNNHEGFEKPKMSFVPSIGIGPIAVYPRGGEVDAWSGDLLVAGMRSMTLYRAHRSGDAITNVEPLLAGFRIRDIRLGRQGRLYLKTDDGRFIRTETAVIHRRGVAGHPVATIDSPPRR
jgi:glucose/arabinose dehydrogenase